MNMFALIQLQRLIANKIVKLTKHTVELDRYVHMTDSYHIYGSYFNEFEQRFLGGLERRTFAKRTFRYADIKDITEEARPMIMQKVQAMTETM